MKLFIILCAIVTAFSCIVMPVQAQDALDFGDSLFSEQDFFRAISVYKEIHFFSDDPVLKNYCSIRISESYLRSGKYLSAIQSAIRLSRSPDPYLARSAALIIGLSYLGLNNTPLAAHMIDKSLQNQIPGDPFPYFYKAVFLSQTEDWALSSELFKNIAVAYPETETGTVSSVLSELSLSGLSLETRSPVLAATFSALVPGAGQLYAGHPVDAVQAFLAVGTLALASYGVYLYDAHFRDDYLYTGIAVSLTGVFYVSNILGAIRTASFFNTRKKLNLKEAISKQSSAFQFIEREKLLPGR